MEIDIIDIKVAKEFCKQHHYSNIFPPHCKIALGFYDKASLGGVAIWGWAARPVHTIKRLFPSLGTSDYLELCRLCCKDELPRNTESMFLGQCVRWFKQNKPEIKLLFSWSDGIRGKAGYVYQGSNWLYGGFINTEIYLTKDNEPLHPRLLITRFGSRSKKIWTSLNLTRIKGKQFRYCKFLCSHKERKRLLSESNFKWHRNYPKASDLVWQIDAGEGSRETCNLPKIERSGQFRQSAFCK